jgi:hypothetical protein
MFDASSEPNILFRSIGMFGDNEEPLGLLLFKIFL